MKKLSIVTALLFAFAAPAQAEKLKVTLEGYQEVPSSLNSPASAEFEAEIRGEGVDTTIDWTLSYGGFTTPVLQAHIHFGQRHTNGGISIWLCGNVANTPPGVQPCPSPGGEISGHVTAASVVGPAGQLIAPGAIADIVAAIRAGVAYVNIHSTAFGGGEVRGQFTGGHSHGNQGN